jgi:hypothetical protein
MRLEPIEVMRSYTVARLQGEALSLGLARSAVARRFFALTQPETILPLASHSQACDGLPKGLVLDPGVDLGRGDVPVAEGSLHQPQVAGLRVKPSGEGMPERMDRQGLGNSSKLEPVSEPQLHLSMAKSVAAARTEQRRSIGDGIGFDVQTEESAKRRVKKDRLLSSTLCFDCDGALSDVNVSGVQADKRAQPDASAEEKREHRVVSCGDGRVGVDDRGQQLPRFVDRQVAGHSPIRWRRANQPCRVVVQVPSVGEEAEENSERRLGSVDSERGLWLTVTINKEACERVGSDDADLDIALEPASKLPQIPEVSLPRAFALAICPELRVEAGDGCRKLHGFTSIAVDSEATSMNALSSKTVNSIMRTICLFGQLFDPLGATVRHVDATQALCAPISLEVANLCLVSGKLRLTHLKWEKPWQN